MLNLGLMKIRLGSASLNQNLGPEIARPDPEMNSASHYLIQDMVQSNSRPKGRLKPPLSNFYFPGITK
jgi:hypothetical protein